MKYISLILTTLRFVAASEPPSSCPDYADYSKEYHAPFSTGMYNLSYQRPAPACRTVNSTVLEGVISEYQSIIKDPDLYRLFENSFPNTLDTAIKWQGVAANNSEEELTFVITGDINAMWLRDSANQMQSYLSFLNCSTTPVFASLYRGVINLQSRYILTQPFCNSFQPPAESGLPPEVNNASLDDMVYPPYNNQSVFECKYELDSLAAFLEISHNYYYATNDSSFFGKFQWTEAVQNLLNVATAMQDTPTYAANGMVNQSPYTFQRMTNIGTETLSNTGRGNPVQGGTGLVRSAFRPSDDACIFQLFIPANMMFARYLNSTSAIAAAIGEDAMAGQMVALATEITQGIYQHGIVYDPTTGNKIFAYEIDGYGSQNLMDDANIPSLLSAPVYDFLSADDTTYQSTRAKLLSTDNPYWMFGPITSGIGGPHDGPGFAWPMANIVRILTSSNESEVYDTLKTILSSTDGLGLIHESQNTFNVSDWTRQWFSWANGLLGQMILDLDQRMPQLLQESYQ